MWIVELFIGSLGVRLFFEAPELFISNNWGISSIFTNEINGIRNALNNHVKKKDKRQKIKTIG